MSSQQERRQAKLLQESEERGAAEVKRLEGIIAGLKKQVKALKEQVETLEEDHACLTEEAEELKTQVRPSVPSGAALSTGGVDPNLMSIWQSAAAVSKAKASSEALSRQAKALQEEKAGLVQQVEDLSLQVGLCSL